MYLFFFLQILLVIPYINLLNRSWIIKCLSLMNTETLSHQQVVQMTCSNFRTNMVRNYDIPIFTLLSISFRKSYLELFITKTYLHNYGPLKPHFYIVKPGFTGVYIIFLISVQKHRLWVLVRTASARRF